MFGWGNGSTTGYNCEEVQNLREVINQTATQSANDIIETLHNSIIVPMSSVWYAPEAVTFFEGFQADVRNIGKTITQAFDGFRQFVQDAGTSWAENTKGAAPSLSPIDLVELNLSVSEIQPDNNGNITIDGSRATTIANSLSQVEEEIKAKLQQRAGNLSAETAFIGGNQSQSLQNCFETVAGAVHHAFRCLTEGDNALQTQINKAVEKYSQIAQDINSVADKVTDDSGTTAQ